MRRDRSTHRRISRLGMVHTAGHVPDHAPRGELGRYARDPPAPAASRAGNDSVRAGRAGEAAAAPGGDHRATRRRGALRALRPASRERRLGALSAVPAPVEASPLPHTAVRAGRSPQRPCAVRFRVCARERLLGARALYVAAARQAELGRACRWRPHPRPPHRRLDRPAPSLHRPPHGGGLRLLVRPGPLPQIAYDGRSAAMVEPLHGRAERLRAFAPCSHADAARCALLLPLPPARHG
jgi:hypothetical protein